MTLVRARSGVGCLSGVCVVESILLRGRGAFGTALCGRMIGVCSTPRGGGFRLGVLAAAVLGVEVAGGRGGVQAGLLRDEVWARMGEGGARVPVGAGWRDWVVLGGVGSCGVSRGAWAESRWDAIGLGCRMARGLSGRGGAVVFVVELAGGITWRGGWGWCWWGLGGVGRGWWSGGGYADGVCARARARGHRGAWVVRRADPFVADP